MEIGYACFYAAPSGLNSLLNLPSAYALSYALPPFGLVFRNLRLSFKNKAIIQNKITKTAPRT
jgi:hypothetical protein